MIFLFQKGKRISLCYARVWYAPGTRSSLLVAGLLSSVRALVISQPWSSNFETSVAVQSALRVSQRSWTVVTTLSGRNVYLTTQKKRFTQTGWTLLLAVNPFLSAKAQSLRLTTLNLVLRDQGTSTRYNILFFFVMKLLL